MNIGRTLLATPRRAVGVLLLLAFVLTACGGVSGESWAGIAADTEAKAIYVAYNERVVALNPATGESLWRYSYENAKFFAPPTVVDGTLYIGDYVGRLHCLDTATGEARWIYEPERRRVLGPLSPDPTDRVISPVTVGPELAYIGMGSRNVVAVSLTTHEKVWTFETDHGVWAQPLYLPADAELGREQDVLYIVSLDHFLYALEPATGRVLWKKDLGAAAPGDPVYDPALNRLYIGTFVSELLAIDLNTHAIVDRFETQDWLWGAPWLDGDMLYFGDLSGTLYAVRTTEAGFEEVWSRELTEAAIRATPLVTDDLIVVGARDKHIYALNKADGTNRWYEQTKSALLANLVYVPGDPDDPEAAGLVIVGSDSGDELVYAYNLATGSRSWRYGD